MASRMLPAEAARERVMGGSEGEGVMVVAGEVGEVAREARASCCMTAALSTCARGQGMGRRV
jgi:hypothetical protein